MQTKLPDGPVHFNPSSPPSWVGTVAGDDIDTPYGIYTWNDDLQCYVSMNPPESFLYIYVSGGYGIVTPPGGHCEVGDWS